MRKAVFLLGMVILLIGVAFARPADTRDAIERIEHEDAHDALLENYNSSYEQAEDQAGDNMDVASYGVAMVGILVLLLSVMKRKEQGSGLLYQGGDKQNISPKDLERSITRPIDSPVSNGAPGMAPNTTVERPSISTMELPALGDDPVAPPPEPAQPQVPQPNLIANPHVTPTPPSKPAPKFDGVTGKPIVMESAECTVNGVGGNGDASAADSCRETTLSCPNCAQDFSLKGNIQEVICPRCGKRFRTQGLMKH
jgi:hypothetical protein